MSSEVFESFETKNEQNIMTDFYRVLGAQLNASISDLTQKRNQLAIQHANNRVSKQINL